MSERNYKDLNDIKKIESEELSGRIIERVVGRTIAVINEKTGEVQNVDIEHIMANIEKSFFVANGGLLN